MNSSPSSSSLGHFDYYNVNDLEKQLPEYRWCPYNDSIIIPISQDAEDSAAASLQDSTQPEDEPDIENAIVRPTENRYSNNDYYNSLISYYMNMCNSTYTLLDFDFRD
jgi:hypothetical protein